MQTRQSDSATSLITWAKSFHSILVSRPHGMSASGTNAGAEDERRQVNTFESGMSGVRLFAARRSAPGVRRRTLPDVACRP
eukprot:CAMPEP_0168465894 /NCGR_PEP_ID=MMETSP0228-20121227/56364_1 /TAXON_ID=133427 /ORGANISM="Protoceratium reticulatum, Strain CCCM 535 (=CCMP 1889)" /LENGTH=80 /DNA_ID=CAMNT_0008481511 /DNA_START=67 /DNA_END=305 /DNA_ORIENTATION=-